MANKIIFLFTMVDFVKLSANNQARAGQARAIEAIVKAMNTHINNSDVCINGCCALKAITNSNGKRNQRQNANLFDSLQNVQLTT